MGFSKKEDCKRGWIGEVRQGTMDRREFLSRMTAVGVGVTAAYGMIGLPAPALAQEAPQQGGTLRVGMFVRQMKDPRTFDWPEMANFCRGWLEYLVDYHPDGTFTGVLLDNWEINDDATQYILNVRQGVTWNNGDPFTAEDVARNISGWCDSTMEGNSMASRFEALIDSTTGKARDGAIEVVDDHTVHLNLGAPDITLIASMSDYPAAIVHSSMTGNPLDNPIGTGPYIPESYDVGDRAVLVRNTDHTWWNEGNGAWLDRIEYVDTGSDMSAAVITADSGEIDMVNETATEFAILLEDIGFERSETVTANTIVIRTNQKAMVGESAPYADVRVRRALQLAVDNATCLELGGGGFGQVAENHHACPIHPEYVELPAPATDIEQAQSLMEEAGMSDFEHDLISTDETWIADTTTAVAAQLREAGFNVKRTIVPGSTFWNDWNKYPFSSSTWGHRPLAVQVYALAYKSGAAWNETAFSNEEFDTLLAEAITFADPEQRKGSMKRLEEIMIEQGVIIQPFWRNVMRHHAPNVGGAEAHPSQNLYPEKLYLKA